MNPSSSATTVSSAAILPVVSSPPARKDVEEIHTCVTRIEQDYIEPWVTRISQIISFISPLLC